MKPVCHNRLRLNEIPFRRCAAATTNAHSHRFMGRLNSLFLIAFSLVAGFEAWVQPFGSPAVAIAGEPGSPPSVIVVAAVASDAVVSVDADASADVELAATESALSLQENVAASGDSLAGLFSSGCVGFLETSRLPEAVRSFATSPYAQQIWQSPQMQGAMRLPQMRKAFAGQQLIERQIGMDLLSAVEAVLGGRSALAVYAPKSPATEPRFVLVAKVADMTRWKALQQAIAPLLVLAEDEITVTERPDGSREIMLRPGVRVVWNDQWIAAATAGDDLSPVLKRLAGESVEGTTLQDDAGFAAMRASQSPGSPIHAYLNMEQLKTPDGQRLVPEKFDNGLVSLLFGGVVEVAARSPWVSATADLGTTGFTVTVSATGTAATLPEAWKSLVADAVTAGAAQVPEIPGLIGAWVLHRDFGAWYRNRDALLQASVLPGFDEFETGIANLLPGRDFGQDVLPLLGKNLIIVAAPQDYSNLDGKPGVQLPAFGLIVELAQPQEAADLFQVFFQSITTIMNFESSKQGRQPWVVASETYKDIQISFAKYLKKPKGNSLPIVFNFTPTSALVGERFLICSSQGLCRQLIDAYQTPPAARAGALPRGDVLTFNGQAVAEEMRKNRAALEAQAVTEGKTTEQAATELTAVLDVLSRISSVRLETIATPQEYKLRLEGVWK